ncbi:NAD(P)/FAD-dependent oxidoreductase [Streptomyces albipurpureus]|uniref:Tryptophan 7-halogenase n=1 Tax=Streptomyces albipurpureus TaxID=2897419 RepID=A0ABT0UR72_9ACTN|nr:tryptophan 7-halogenase [Streptomyces sp. CWNU-1]MCM2389888.1 tryptophan 7-halogenase [Streptomyces sp. CWNU-1]
MSETSERFDVAILGGGIAGLTLALQLKRTDPDLHIAVLERQRHPVPEAAHKVGESSVEIQAHYLRDVLGLEEHLNRHQLHKFGLRMFLSHAGNEDITRRVEYGQIAEAPLAAYQLDRGRLENALGTIVTGLGVDFRQRCKVREVDLSTTGDHHVVRVLDGEDERTLKARWVVDASGRAGLLKRKLGLARAVGHRANASWFRIDREVDVQQWSKDEQWRARVSDGLRRLSTNHLMGPGYWVWLIPLASGSTSIGIVADDATHSFEGFNTLERALDWLTEHEPQCAAEVRRHLAKIQDFRVMKDYAYGCQQVYSEDRWCLTGEAGVSIDPLYSSGGDLMAISNGLITDLVIRDRRGEDVQERTVAHNQVYLVLSEIWLVAYEGQYPVMGNPQAMVAKVIWDTIIYWAVPGLLFFHDKLRSLGESPRAFANLQRTWLLHTRVQEFFREWHLVSNEPASDVFADPYSLMEFIVDLHNGMAAGLDDEELEEQFGRNVILLEELAGQLVSTVIERLEQRGADDDAKARIGQWRTDELLREAVERYQQRDPDDPIDSAWITLGAQSAAVAP